MDLKMKYEINNLVKHGIPEDVAIISVCLKYNKKELADDLINERKEEQELLREELEKFVEFKIEETCGEIMSANIVEDLGKT
jgi:hypothetical protein